MDFLGKGYRCESVLRFPSPMHMPKFPKRGSLLEGDIFTNWMPLGNFDKEHLLATLRIIGPSNRGVCLTLFFGGFF